MFSSKESLLINELKAFALGISNNPLLYGVAVPDAATIQSAVDEFVVGYTVWNTPATRNPLTRDAKQALKVSALGVCRVFYRQIQGNVGISDADKIAINVKPLNNTRTNRPCTTASPMVSVTASTPGAQTVEFRDSLDISRRGLAPNATMCQLFVQIGEENAQTFDETKARFIGAFTQNPVPVVFNPADRGKQATYFARWGGKRAQVGQWSLPVSMTIAA